MTEQTPEDGPAATDEEPETPTRDEPEQAVDDAEASDPASTEPAADGAASTGPEPADSEPAEPESTEPESTEPESTEPDADPTPGVPDDDNLDVPEDVATYDRFKKMDGAQYERVNEFLRDRTYITAREWAIARLCSDFRTETGVEMTKIGENLPELVPFMTDTYTPQAVNQARSAFEDKIRTAGATFLYGAMCDFFTAEELDDVMYEATEVAKFLLEVEGVNLSVEEELEAEERISSVMREVREASSELREQEE
ncbi:DUF5806 family protein [Haloarchaeobius amylolyticus]|uniref:DUF5806 family protein n=1 Tax=Haloarchaeobius amylolyticus TaxID=1198296 RepID=UPI002270C87A|nr:DUF5806 family protein [Haloarchaeobius amylolyticus]